MRADIARSLRDEPEPADARLARLAEVLVLIERLSGEPGAPIVIGPHLADAYAAAGPIARRRFDALAAETAAIAATGIEILLRQPEDKRAGHPAARRLAMEMRGAIDSLMGLILRGRVADGA